MRAKSTEPDEHLKIAWIVPIVVQEKRDDGLVSSRIIEPISRVNVPVPIWWRIVRPKVCEWPGRIGGQSRKHPGNIVDRIKALFWSAATIRPKRISYPVNRCAVKWCKSLVAQIVDESVVNIVEVTIQEPAYVFPRLNRFGYSPFAARIPHRGLTPFSMPDSAGSMVTSSILPPCLDVIAKRLTGILYVIRQIIRAIGMCCHGINL